MTSISFYNIAILAVIGVYFVKNISADVPTWESVFRDYESPVIPLRHWGNKSYYVASGIQLTWYEALSFCQHIHMQLLTINSEEEHKIIYKYIRETSKGFEYWTSGTRILDGNKWVWLPYGDLVDYTKWSNGQPSDPNGEKCLQLWKIGENLEWNDRPCDTRFHFICERYDSQNRGPAPNL